VNHTEPLVQVAGRELVISRTLNAPRALVYRAFTEPEHLKQWWGPKEWPVVYCTVDLRPGGKWHYCMRSSDGQESWGVAVYEEIVPDERIVYVDAFSDAEGNVNSALPMAKSTVEFSDADGKTRMVMRAEYPTEADLQTVVNMGMIEGIKSAWSQLEDLLERLQSARG